MVRLTEFAIVYMSCKRTVDSDDEDLKCAGWVLQNHNAGCSVRRVWRLRSDADPELPRCVYVLRFVTKPHVDPANFYYRQEDAWHDQEYGLASLAQTYLGSHLIDWFEGRDELRNEVKRLQSYHGYYLCSDEYWIKEYNVAAANNPEGLDFDW